MERDLRVGITQHLIRCREVGATRSPQIVAYNGDGGQAREKKSTQGFKQGE